MQCRFPILVTVKGRQIYVPCGKCAWCVANARADWFVRLRFEAKSALYRSFVTLTYDDDHLPVKLDKETGLITPTVSLRDIQLFHMKVRKKHKFRFMICSEYGPKTGRPHYHGVYFHNEPIDFVHQWQNGENCTQYPAKDGSFLYISKYMLKGSNVPVGADPNFRTMSRRPGIGSDIDVDPDYHYLLLDNAIKTRIPRYYKKRYYARLDDQLRNYFQEMKLDYLADQPQHASYHRRFDELIDSGEVDPANYSFEDWLSDLYKKDFCKQIKINSK